jgi:CheY-like chemotaxis protein
MRALIIEDDAVIAMSIEDELRDLGYSSIEIAVTEEEAIQAAAKAQPDLLTCDGRLLSGSALRAVRKIQASCSVPVIFITGDPDRVPGWFPRTRVVAKPFSSSELCSAVQHASPIAAASSTRCVANADDLKAPLLPERSPVGRTRTLQRTITRPT